MPSGSVENQLPLELPVVRMGSRHLASTGLPAWFGTSAVPVYEGVQARVEQSCRCAEGGGSLLGGRAAGKQLDQTTLGGHGSFDRKPMAFLDVRLRDSRHKIR